MSFDDNMSSDSRGVPWERTDGRTDS